MEKVGGESAFGGLPKEIHPCSRLAFLHQRASITFLPSAATPQDLETLLVRDIRTGLDETRLIHQLVTVLVCVI